MALVYHPDRNTDAAANAVFIKIKEAYDVLCDAARVRELNRLVDTRVGEVTIGTLTLNFGCFFGYRVYPPGHQRPRHPRLTGRGPAGPTARQQKTFGDFDEMEGNCSVLDDPAFDYLELVFAGRFTPSDCQALSDAFHEHDFGVLPWYVLNNQGIVQFLEQDYVGALDTYRLLNERVPHNIVFLYRLGLCHEVVAYLRRKRNLLGLERPDRRCLATAIDCFREAIRLGEERLPPQQCITIRRTLADLFERTGRTRRALGIRQAIETIIDRTRERRIVVAIGKTTPDDSRLLPKSGT